MCTFQPLKYILIPKTHNKLPETVRKQMIPVLIAPNKCHKLEVLQHTII